MTVALSTVGNVYRDPYCADVLAGKTESAAVAAPSLKVIVGEMIVHFAYKIKFEVVVTTPLTAIGVPVPAALVFQPANS